MEDEQIKKFLAAANTLYKTIPVTLGYSQIFADVVKQSSEIVNATYDYRFFM